MCAREEGEDVVGVVDGEKQLGEESRVVGKGSASFSAARLGVNKGRSKSTVITAICYNASP